MEPADERRDDVIKDVAETLATKLQWSPPLNGGTATSYTAEGFNGLTELQWSR